jgi:hypothetical protein
MSRKLLGLSLAAALLLPSAGSAQDWRTVTTMRQYSGEERVRVNVEYGAGELTVQPADAGALYRATLRYDADTFRPVTSYRDGSLRLGLEGGRSGIRNLRDQRGARLSIALGADAPLDLNMSFGAGKAEMELGGMRLRDLQVSTGASETTLRFSAPNPERLGRMKLEAGAAAFHVFGLGHANVERLDFSGGVGDIVLDFGGAWRGDLNADISMGIGSLTLHLPRHVGIRLRRETFLSSFEARGLVRRGNMYYSENWDTATHKLTININAAFGSINVRWTGAAAS